MVIARQVTCVCQRTEECSERISGRWFWIDGVGPGNMRCGHRVSGSLGAEGRFGTTASLFEGIVISVGRRHTALGNFCAKAEIK